MDILAEQLITCSLFKGYTVDEISDLLKKTNYSIMCFSQRKTLLLQGDTLDYIGIVLKGKVAVLEILLSGKEALIKHLKSGDLYGQGVIMSTSRTVPSTLVVKVDTKVLRIDRDDLLELCYSEKRLLNNFLVLISNQMQYLNKQFRKNVSMTIREKIADFLITQYIETNKIEFMVDLNRNEMAEFFSVTRPALSSELMKLKEESVIDYDRDWFRITDLEILKNIIN